MINIKNGVISGILLVSVYAIDFFKLSKIRRPRDTKQAVQSAVSKNHDSQVLIVQLSCHYKSAITTWLKTSGYNLVRLCMTLFYLEITEWLKS